MKTTDNYGLKKPDYTDVRDVAVLNENADAIDAALSAHDRGLAGKLEQGDVAAISNSEILAIFNRR